VTDGTSIITFLDDATAYETTLTNSGLTATRTLFVGGGMGGGRSIAYRSTGKFYFEHTATTVSFPGNGAAGILASTGIYSNLSSTNTLCSEVYFQSGTIYSNNASTGVTIGSVVSGNNIGVAVDLTARRIWFRRNGGNWNNSGTANPATGVGGFVVGAGDFAPVIGIAQLNDVATANFGASAFVYTPPSGFGNWLQLAGFPGTATWVQLSGTSPTVTDAGAVEFAVNCDGVAGSIEIDDWSFA
jgi:hypothetical protein